MTRSNIDQYPIETSEVFDDVYATQKALVQHLTQYHGKTAISKHSKDSLMEMHEAIHQRQALGSENWQQGFHMRYDSERPNAHGTGMGTYVYYVHTHQHVAPEDTANYQVPDLDKPLSSQEAAALKAVIDADFEALEQSIRSMAQTEKETRRAEVEKEWQARETKVNTYRDKRTKVYEDFRQRLNDLRDKAAEDGITLDVNVTLTHNVSLTGKAEAVKAVLAEVDGALNQALTTARRQHAAALRTVALARITPEARKVLDGIPDAQSLMVEAAKERAEITA